MKQIVIVLFLVVSAWSNEFDTAVDDYNKGSYIKALNSFYVLAKNGDAKAQYNVGMIYANGKGVKKDVPQAMEWYEKAAQQGNASAAYNYNNLAALYLEGKNIPRNNKKAFELFKKAADKGDANAQINVAVMYAWGEDIPNDKMKAYDNFKKALNAGKIEASQYLDRLCKESAWVCKN
jgi:TPR repeat protein